MLYRFIVENYKCFRIRNEISFIPNGAERQSHVATNNSGYPVLKSAVIYGSNAAGKTKFVEAIAYAASIVLGRSEIRYETNKAFMLDSESRNKPTLFVFELIINGNLYQYAFAISFKDASVVEEFLSIWDETERRFNNIFSREKNILFSDRYTPKGSAVIDFLTIEIDETPEKLALSFLSQVKALETPLKMVVDEVYGWFQRLTILFPNTKFNLLKSARKGVDEVNKIYKSNFAKFGIEIKELDLKLIQIDKLDIPKQILEDIRKDLINRGDLNAVIHIRTDNEDYLLKVNEDRMLEAYSIMFVHEKNGRAYYFEKEDESDGTLRLFDFIPLFSMLAEEGRTVIIDELNRSLHPLMTRHLVDAFFKTADGVGCQLFFTTHDVMLLNENLFYPSEVWFVDKKDDVSTIYPLSKFDLRQLPKETDKNYLLGRFGAIPFA